MIVIVYFECVKWVVWITMPGTAVLIGWVCSQLVLGCSASPLDVGVIPATRRAWLLVGRSCSCPHQQPPNPVVPNRRLAQCPSQFTVEHQYVEMT